jgi:hypothetical protein
MPHLARPGHVLEGAPGIRAAQELDRLVQVEESHARIRGALGVWRIGVSISALLGEVAIRSAHGAPDQVDAGLAHCPDSPRPVRLDRSTEVVATCT